MEGNFLNMIINISNMYQYMCTAFEKLSCLMLVHSTLLTTDQEFSKYLSKGLIKRFYYQDR